MIINAMIICFLFGIISVLYGLSVMRIASGTSFFMVWFAIGIAFFLLGLAIHFHWLSVIPKALRIVLAVLVAAGVIVLAVTGSLIGAHMNDRGQKDLDYIIVLGAQVKETSSGMIPSTVLTYRLDTALSYLKDNPRTRCVVSGGNRDNEPAAEAVVMKDWLVERGIDADRIITEDRSASTAENLRYSLAAIETDQSQASGTDSNTDSSASALTVGIVTNNFHVYRSTHIAVKTGFSDVSGIAAYSTPFYLPNNILREMLGIVKDKLVGNL